MAPKHKNYKPQVRRQKVASDSEIEHTNEVLPASFEYVAGALGITEDDNSVKSVGDYIYKRDFTSLGWRPAEFDDDDDIRKILMVNAAEAFVELDDLCMQHEVDVTSNDILYNVQNISDRTAQINMFASFMTDRKSTAIKFELNRHTSLLAIAKLLFAGRRGAYDVADFTEEEGLYPGDSEIHYDETIDIPGKGPQPLDDYILSDKQWIEREFIVGITENLARTRRQLIGAMKSFRNPETRAFLAAEREKLNRVFFGDATSEIASESMSILSRSDPEDILLFEGQKVDFTILPPGTDVREYTHAVVENLGPRDRESLDIRRVGVLEDIRAFMGEERTYYVHGTSQGGDEVGGVRKDYIGLVVQTHDNDGKVVAEDAIAVSPLARRNAGYIFRSDVSTHTSWREVLSSAKPDARRSGARPLKFTHVHGSDMYEKYVEKALELLTCPASQFGADHELSRRKTGEYRMRKSTPRASLGKTALGEVM